MARGKARTRHPRRRSARGFTYLAVLFAVALIGLSLAAVGQLWDSIRQREREAELLFVGNQYRQAIGAYYRQPASPGRYPPRLEDLLKDPRAPQTARYLRRLYPDPISGKPEWGTVKGPDGGIAGIYSLSEKEPLKIANFRLREGAFEKKMKYSEWQFIYAPTTTGAFTPAATQVPSTTAPTAPTPTPTR